MLVLHFLVLKFIIPGRPISKSNFKLSNSNGQVWLPHKGKYSKYAAYENYIAGIINQNYFGPPIEDAIITILKLFFPNKRIGDIHNYPKSICDGIEKSGIILNDKQLKPFLILDSIDKENPRVEIELYNSNEYVLEYEIKPK